MEIAKIKLRQLCEHGDLLDRFGVKLNVLGQLDLVREDVREVIDEAVEITKDNNKFALPSPTSQRNVLTDVPGVCSTFASLTPPATKSRRRLAPSYTSPHRPTHHPRHLSVTPPLHRRKPLSRDSRILNPSRSRRSQNTCLLRTCRHWIC